LCWVFSRQGSENYLPRLASNCHLPNLCPGVARITGVSHWSPAKVKVLDTIREKNSYGGVAKIHSRNKSSVREIVKKL
jgi:hypothetical protein